ncbi:MAG TPA: DUF5602 domain-containing protein [Fimbriimonadaceae bacterium]|nr:DUF5602 domain-containing protein [Fimbriimonadaceae bacterium]
MKARTIGMLALSGAIVSAATTASACENCKKGFVFGKPVAIGNGMAFTWVKFNKATKKIESVGITMTETALEGLPKASDIKSPIPMEMWDLELPKEIQGLPYDHVEIDWNPVGHPPAKIYDKPHFDFHFYTIDSVTQQKITAAGADLKRCLKKPDAKFVPAGYILPPDTSFPKMGTHWINPATAPELSGGKFTSTFIYGTYNGRTAFWEPMITKEFLESKPAFWQKIAPPKAYDTTGYYPTSYSVKYNADRHEFSVSLNGLVYRKASRAR